MNFANMLQQAQKMQKKVQDAQSELEEQRFEAEVGNGSVKVCVNGLGKFKSIKLKPEALNPENPASVDNDTIEMLEDMITQAMQQATNTAHEKADSVMKNITGGIKIPGLF